ncbi:F-box protein SKIP23-like [Tasmannia lanceolata]|uniref:F-box protein SKIP23-like n=1 Tax=Tasmannia lanceolata TaxID=3420 RepID=UPI0040642155
MNSDMDKWPELPNDLLAVVFDHLLLSIVRIRFGAVCSSWYQFTMENCHWLDFHYQLPFMLVYDKERTETRNFYNITENKFYDIQLPEFHGKWCCGSSKGWVVTVDESTNIHLLDPFTSTQIQLPSLDKFPDPQFISWPELPWDYTYIRKALLSANPLSTPDYVVVTIVSSMLKLSFYKPGDEKWTTLENQWGPYEDVIYYKDKFYAITSNDAVVTCEFASNYFPKFTVVTPPSRELCSKRHLVESCGKLLKVSSRHEWNPGYDYDENRNLIQPIPEWAYRTVWFNIFELDEDTRKWIKTENLGDQTLFLGYNSSFSLSVRDFPHCKGNCIYFTDSNGDAPDCNYDNGIYNLEDKSFKRINFFHRITKPLWVPRYLDTYELKDLSCNCFGVAKELVGLSVSSCCSHGQLCRSLPCGLSYAPSFFSVTCSPLFVLMNMMNEKVQFRHIWAEGLMMQLFRSGERVSGFIC